MTSAPASLKTNFRWVMAGNVVNSASQWLVVSLLARLGSAEILGTYILAMAVIMPVTTFSKLSLRSLFVTDAREKHLFGDYFATGLWSGLLGFLIISGWGLIQGFEPGLFLILVPLGLARSLDNPSELFMGYCQKQERMEFVGMGMMLRGTTSLAAVALAVGLTGSLAAGAAALLAAALLRILFFEFPVARRLARLGSRRLDLKLTLPWPTGRAIAAMGIPLGLVLFLATLGNSLIRLTLESYHGKEQLAYFGAAAYPLMIGSIFVGALGQSAAPRLARDHAVNRRRFWALLSRLGGLAALMGLAVLAGVWLVGKPALEILYGSEYGAYHAEFMVMAAGSVFMFSATIVGYGLTAARKFSLQLVGAATACLAAGLLAWIMIPDGGIMGAAWVYFWVAVVHLVTKVLTLAWPGSGGGTSTLEDPGETP
jgi:O-antigen/teichoic acid export membrane protein